MLQEINERKTIQLFCYYILPLFAILTATYISINAPTQLYAYAGWIGIAAIYLLMFIMYIKPLSMIFHKIPLFRKLLSYRRELGVLTFYLAMLHALTMLIDLNLYTSQNIIWLFDTGDFLFYGFMAAIGMFILGITSNRLSVMKLKGNWKKLQMYIGYPTFFLAITHYAMIKSSITPVLILAIYAILKVMQLKKIKIPSITPTPQAAPNKETSKEQKKEEEIKT